MIRDRGNIKWTSMMLPEHVKELRDWKTEEKRSGKPVLDEQKMAEMNETICEAMAVHNSLCFQYFSGGETKTLFGYVHYVDPLTKELRIIDHNEKRTTIKLLDLVHVELE
ncbi:YolD-like family protein [Anaerobacillus sp. 1_MG-2023]|uniref:YolD-like family protein n=1 Tax=Bacillales TaxID=1385 RepID=UPI0026E40C70|nr:YolD-like family protein [Anaerobacillus sp. 1_MG-2023]MDO6655241.1 YolD-like family protein [Anaerobacillus sp. 1_MG-2023]